MAKRVCVFVDGENFRYAIGDLFAHSDRKQYLPKTADWEDLFNWLVQEVEPGAERIRTYWYVVAHIDFFPYRFPDAERETNDLRRLLSKDAQRARELQGLGETQLVERLKGMVRRLSERRDQMQRRFDGWTAIQNGIATRHRGIEFRRAGAIRYNLFDGSLGPEKAVDVMLATDLIVLRDIYDTAVIVSGDQDYVPAVQKVKDFGGCVVNVAFKRRDGRLLPGGARRLNQITDWSLCVGFDDFARRLRVPDA